MIWKDILGYEGYYQISENGTIKSLERVVKHGNSVRHEKEKIKKHTINNHGYPVVSLCKNGVTKHFAVHRLLAIAFIPNPDNKPFVDHINTYRTDFRLENLRWVTAKENANNPITLEKCKTNLYIPEVAKKMIKTKKNSNKEYHGKPKKVYQFNLHGSLIGSYSSLQEAFEITGVNPVSISRVCKRSMTTAGGFVWSFEKDGFYLRKNNYHGFRVYQLDSKTGEMINEFESICSAEKATGCQNIARNSKSKTIRGKYRWIIERY